MPATSDVTQAQLVAAILKRVNTTSVDFQEVADELGLTKGAAQKRWQRYSAKLLKDGEKVDGATTPKKGAASTPKKPRATPKKAAKTAVKSEAEPEAKDEDGDDTMEEEA